MSDYELIALLRNRDGEVSSHPPRHIKNGACKYIAHYPAGGCPWCEGLAATHTYVGLALAS